MRPFDDRAPMRAIIGYQKDEEDNWVARLDCRHTHHLRHQPPWQSRPWVLTEEGRSGHLGTLLPCMKCLQGEPPGW